MNLTGTTVVVLLLTLSGCATACYFDARGNRLPGLPFVWKDHKGKAHLAYVRTTSGFGQATFTVDRGESGGYTKFATNVDSSAGADLAGTALDRAVDVGRRAAWADLRSRALQLEEGREKRELLRRLEDWR